MTLSLIHALGCRCGVLCFAAAMVLLAGCYGTDTTSVDGTGREALRSDDVSSVSLDRPVVEKDLGYVGSDACQVCHEHAHATWHNSYHRTMTQVASEESVAAPFDDVTVEILGTKYELSQHEGKHWARLSSAADTDASSPAGDTDAATPPWREVVVTTGSHQFQTYWLSTDRGRALELFPLFYRLSDQKFVPEEAVFLRAPEVTVDRRPGLWNYMCSGCHTTRPQPRATIDSRPQTVVAEFGISCEACHGPGDQHIRNVEANLLQDLAVVHPGKLSADRSAQVCGQCHCSTGFKSPQDEMLWAVHGYAFRPGDDLEDHHMIHRSGDLQFWADGTIRVTGREYNGLLESPCHTHADEANRMTCLSCHKLHQDEDDPRPVKQWANDLLKPAMDSKRPGIHNNQACTQCHSDYEDEAALVAHTHHEAASTGSQCYNCHMPHTSWGLMGAIRSHTIGSPSVQESLAPVERPNACNLCHLDQTLAWTSQHLADRYGQEPAELSEDEATLATGPLWALKGAAGQRALVAWSLGWQPARAVSGDDWQVPILTELMLDRYHVVRSAAGESLRRFEGYEDVEYDFLAPDAERRAAIAETLRRWESRPASEGLASSEKLLLDAGGRLHRDRVDRLLRERDNRTVHLIE